MRPRILAAVAVALISVTLTATPTGALIALPPPSVAPVNLLEITVTVENVAPDDGTNQTPFWVALHDGTFDIYDSGAPASAALERIAEDGAIGPLAADFAASGAGVDGVIASDQGIPPFAPGESGSIKFVVNAQRGNPLFLSYASMVLPSNDAFIANGNPTAIRVINNSGHFLPRSFLVSGNDVLDAGTEVNDELEATTAFFSQAAPDTGTPEGGVVTNHPGFIPDGRILSEFTGADFEQPGYQAVRISTSAERVPRRAFATFSGESEVPPVETDARGAGSLELRTDGSIAYRVTVNNIDNVVGAHIHIAPPGVNGPVAVSLFAINPPEGSDPDQLVLRGSITSSDLTGPLAGLTTLDLWHEVQEGNAYFNVHTTEVPSGEARGNLN